jgi:hypothetical protein
LAFGIANSVLTVKAQPEGNVAAHINSPTQNEVLYSNIVPSKVIVIAPSEEYDVMVHINSPIQNEVFHSSIVPLNVTLSTNINASNTQGLALAGNLDGKVGYHDGNEIDLTPRWFVPPLPAYYSWAINVPNGNHLLWVQVDYYTNDQTLGFYPIENLSQIINFTVYSTTTPLASPSPTPNLTSNPTVPELSTLIILPLPLSLSFVVVMLRSRKPLKCARCLIITATENMGMIVYPNYFLDTQVSFSSRV